MSMFYHKLTIYRVVMSKSKPYYLNPLVIRAIKGSIEPNLVGPVENVQRETALGNNNPVKVS